MKTGLEEAAQAFATARHAAIDQRRKYTGDPYITHPAAVVELVRSVPHTSEMIAAAWLHGEQAAPCLAWVHQGGPPPPPV